MLLFTVFVEDSAALIGIVVAALGVWRGHALKSPYWDPAGSVAILLVPSASAALLARMSVSLLVGPSLDRNQLAVLRKIITADPAIESVGHLLTMRLEPGQRAVTSKLRFRREFSLDQVEQAIARLAQAIKGSYPAILHLYLESGEDKQAAYAAGQVAARESAQAARAVTNLDARIGLHPRRFAGPQPATQGRPTGFGQTNARRCSSLA